MWSTIKNQRELLSRETGFTVKDWGGRISVALVYPNTYRIGMGNLAVHSIYKLLNDHENIVCERAFLPDKPLSVISIETQSPITLFDFIFFSISFQNDFFNILPILSLSKIPYKKEIRNNNHPILVAGGAAVSINPLPVAPIFDVCIRGEFDAISGEIAKIICENEPRDEKIKKLNALASKKHIADLDKLPTQTTIYTEDAEFGGMHLIELSRGCPRRCGFCATPGLYHPYRERGKESIFKMIREGLKHRKKFGLIGSDILSCINFIGVANEINKADAVLSPSSIHVDAINEETASILKNNSHNSISLGVEAGSDSMRKRIGKPVTNETILEKIKILAKNKIRSVRLYFMIGLPGETKEDIESIAGLSLQIKKEISGSATLTVTPFVPKPGTKFENERFAGEKYLKESIKRLQRLLGGAPGIKIHTESITSAMSDAILSNGDEKTFEFIESVFKKGSVRKALKAQTFPYTSE